MFLNKFYAVVSLLEKQTKKRIQWTERPLYNHCGDDSVEDPPVLIPNTEVKLNCAESTWLVTAREDRESPHSTKKELLKREVLFV